MINYIAKVTPIGSLAKNNLRAAGYFEDHGWVKYELGERCIISTGPAKSQCHVYISENAVIIGRLFDRRSGRSLDAVLPNKLTPNSLLQGYWGSYVAFILADDGCVWVVRDPSAGLPCFWSEQNGEVLFFSDISTLHISAAAKLNINDKYIAASVVYNRVNNGETGFDGVYELIPGSGIRITREVSVSHLWTPDRFTREAACHAPTPSDLKAVVMDALDAWRKPYKSILLNLSGGLDSSIVAGCLKVSAIEKVVCLNVSDDTAIGNEKKYAIEVAEKNNFELVEVSLTNPNIDLSTAIDFPAQARPLKFGLGFESELKEMDLINTNEIDAIFSGCGGDIVFQAKRAPFIAGDYLKDQGLAGFFNVCRKVSRLTNRTIWNVLFNAIFQPLRTKRYHYEGRLDFSSINKKWKNEVTYEYLAHPWLKFSSKECKGKKFQISGLIDSHNYFTYRKTSEFSDIVHPLLSQPILEFCLRTPSYRLTPGIIERGLVRAAFKEILPHSVLTRRTKSAGGNFFANLIGHNIEWISGLLRGGELINREIINEEWLEKLISTQANDFGSRFKLYEIATTELWLRKALSMCENE